MVRQSIILSREAVQKADPNDPNVRLHHAAVSVLMIYTTNEKSSLKPSLTKLCRVYNETYLNRPDDKRLIPRTLRGHLQTLRTHIQTLSAPNYLYFHQMKSEQHSLQIQRPFKTKSRSQFGIDSGSIYKQIEIHQNLDPILYSSPKLHKRPHGSALEREISEARAIMERYGIHRTSIHKTLANSSGLVKTDDFVVAFEHSTIIRAIDLAMRGGVTKIQAEFV